MSVDTDGRRPASRSMMQIVESVSTVVAPLAFVTSMLVYVGWIYTREFYGYFGLNPSLISFSSQDYVLRSTYVSFGAVLLLALAGAVLFGLDRSLGWLLQHVGRWESRARQVLVGLGAVLVFISLGGATTEASVAVFPPLAGAVLLGLGAVILLRFGAGSRSSGRAGLLPPAAVGLAAVMLALASFWAMTIYARDLGNDAAEGLDRDPRNVPVVTVYSRDPLDLPGANVVASRVLEQNQQWNYRYVGARLLTYSNNRWFLIVQPGSETYRPSVTILPDTDAIRVETAVPRPR